MKKLFVLIIGIILINAFMTGCSARNVSATNSALTSTPSDTSTAVSAPGIEPTKDLIPTLSPAPTLSPSLTPSPIPTPTQVPVRIISSSIKLGDYLQMGEYYGEPILWRCVYIDENGPLILSDRILTIKAFDGGGINKYLDGTLQTDNKITTRATYGSNLWQTSSLRSWLNSTAVAGKVAWLDGSIPIKETLREGLNCYASEKGFLSDGNFNNIEQNVIKSVTQKSILSSYDQLKLKIGGTEPLINNGRKNYVNPIADIIQNYDTAFYHEVTDKVFILDIKQVDKVRLNDNILGDRYHIGMPTQKLIDNAEYKDTAYLSTGKYWYSWTRTPVCDNSISSLNILSCGTPFQAEGVYYDSANDFYVGVRPAFYIKLSSGVFVDGKGTKEYPLVVD